MTHLNIRILSALIAIIGLACTASASVLTGTLTNGLVSYYEFNGDANDSLGYNNGVVHGGVLTSDQNGVPNSAYYFDGSTGLQTQGITGAYGSNGNDDPNVLTGNFSCSIWFKPTGSISIIPETTAGTAYSAFQGNINNAYWSYNNSGIGISAGTNGVTVFEYANAFIAPVIVYQSPFGNSWVNAMVTVSDNGAPNLYINGQHVDTGLSTGRTKNFTFLDTMDSGYGMFTGSLNDVGIWNRSLSSTEVSALYSAQVIPEPSTYALFGISAIGMLMVLRGKRRA